MAGFYFLRKSQCTVPSNVFPATHRIANQKQSCFKMIDTKPALKIILWVQVITLKINVELRKKVKH